jgi:small-conductance mechanosensitive channel
VITRCDSDDNGQQWTDGEHRYSDNGSFFGRYGGCSEEDLVEYIGLLPDMSQRAPVSRPAETESTTAVAGGVCDDPGRIIFDLKERMKTANAKISCQTAENERLQAEWQTEFTAAQQLRSEGDRLRAEIERLRTELQQCEARNTADAEAAEYAARLEGLLDNSRDALRDLQEDHTAMDHRAEGARSAFLATIKTLWEMRR